MVFLPEKMRPNQARIIEDSDDEGDSDGIEEEGTIDIPEEPTVIKSKKRSRVAIEDDAETVEESISRTAKRQQKTPASKKKRPSRPAATPIENDDDTDPAQTKDQKQRSRRRQSTMTQLVDGRRPLSDTEEPEFKPVKRSPRPGRNSAGKRKKAEKGKQQRTLTQMVPGMRSFEVVSEDDLEETLQDLEAQEEDSQEYDGAVAQRLARQGLHRVESHIMGKRNSDNQLEDDTQSLETDRKDKDVMPSVEDTDEEEDSYRPTQYIDAPATRSSGSSRRRSGVSEVKPEPSTTSTAKPPSASKSRFSLLRTPEKRRIFEIPSSQSPAESPLSAQVSPQKQDRLPLKACSGNPETPSRHKKVAFHEPESKSELPPTLKRFQSTIQDSEDDDEDILDEEMPFNRQDNRVHTQTQEPSKKDFLHGITVGADTQAMLEQIDQVCANAEEDAAWLNQECSEEVNDQPIRSDNKMSHAELEENQYTVKNDRSQETSEIHPHSTEWPDVKKEFSYKANEADPPMSETATSPEGRQDKDCPILGQGAPEFQSSAAPPSSPLPYEMYHGDTFPSTPMIIEDGSSDEEDDPIEVTPHAGKTTIQPVLATMQHSTDLDGELVQVPASPTLNRETQDSHSSKAERQLQAEWLSYSQYLGDRPPQQSSMYVGHDAFSYNTRSRNFCPSAQKPPASNLDLLSQATTVDEVTPKKKRTRQMASINETPHRILSSPTFSISPIKPPPLFIPSSFPSPGEAELEAWSSSAYGKTQDGFGYFGSLEDMSIPPPPPVEDD